MWVVKTHYGSLTLCSDGNGGRGWCLACTGECMNNGLCVYIVQCIIAPDILESCVSFCIISRAECQSLCSLHMLAVIKDINSHRVSFQRCLVKFCTEE